MSTLTSALPGYEIVTEKLPIVVWRIYRWWSITTHRVHRRMYRQVMDCVFRAKANEIMRVREWKIRDLEVLKFSWKQRRGMAHILMLPTKRFQIPAGSVASGGSEG
ncbi:hypothetical protein GX51_06154 [Blastomyces parvus]|uniref:Uncharacterized protein n=1 Tax=Blastomyces parvus TaxID=2060905 RepID=A0A2B7WT60_9EURO|nr:hypothetical protein GX51_06154 [Blastomyces parvus]